MGLWPTAPQWIEVDLGREYILTCARLRTRQPLPGTAVHEMIGRTAGGDEVPLASLAGYPYDYQLLQATLSVTTHSLGPGKHRLLTRLCRLDGD